MRGVGKRFNHDTKLVKNSGIMEKYTVFDDRQNGSNPFRPIRGKRRSFGAKIILFLAMVVLVPLRVVVGTLAMLCAWLFSFVPVRAVRRLSDKLFLRLVLLSLGFWTVGSRLANHRKIGIGARRRYVSFSLLDGDSCS
mgnify:CR=1 FL=1